MKRTLLFGLLFVLAGLALQAAPSKWGAINSGEDPGTKKPRRDGAFYILRQVSSGKPLHVFFETEIISPSENSQTDPAFYKAEIRSAYNDWFRYTVRFIKESERENTFPRMLERLEKGIDVQFVSSEAEADLQVLVTDNKELMAQRCKDYAACVRIVDGLPTVTLPEFSSLHEPYGLLLHELGHTLGLADQYSKSDPDFRSHPFYRSTQIHKSLMAETSKTPTCDDADGIVNLIDVMHGVEHSRKLGWHSLCKDSTDVYMNGIVKGTGPFAISSGHNNKFLVTMYKDGKEQSREVFPLVTMEDPFKEVKDHSVPVSDGLGRPVKAQGPQGETIYYWYGYGGIAYRLITKNENALRWEVYENLDEEVTHTEGEETKREKQRARLVYWLFHLSDRENGAVYATTTEKGITSGGYSQGLKLIPLMKYESGGFDEEMKIEIFPTARIRVGEEMDSALEGEPQDNSLVQQVTQWMNERRQDYKKSLKI